MALFLDRNDPKPLYEQIYRNIREDIENGALRTGTALPSRREMASQCGVSVNTVENAYAQLVAEGFIGAEPKIGYFVEPMGRSRLNTFPEEYTPISPEPSIIGDNSIYDCRFGRIDESAFPHRLWRRCLQGALEKPGALQRGDPQGELLLRQALCGYLHRQRGVVCDPSRVVIGPGLEWLILSLLPFFPEKSLFGMEDPGYTPYR
ncbi:MAG: GntR family transcriptional regulator, partial [Oscillospiraceae bacterium]|nr:GntR family transcriptional regulator [Oscillospiraceae bacterium]